MAPSEYILHTLNSKPISDDSRALSKIYDLLKIGFYYTLKSKYNKIYLLPHSLNYT